MNYSYQAEEDRGAIESIPKFSDLEKVRGEYLEHLKQLNKHLEALNGMQTTLNLYNYDLYEAIRYGRGGIDVDPLVKKMDARLWDLAISTAGVNQVLSSQGEVKLRDKYANNPPEFTADGALALVKQLGDSGAALAQATIREVFSKLIGSKFIRGGRYRWNVPQERRNVGGVQKSFRFTHFGDLRETFWVRDEHFALFNDLEAVCCIVNDLPKPLYPNRIGDTMAQGNKIANPRVWFFDTRWFTVELFKNGNVKIDFTSMETLDRLNRWGSDGTQLDEESA